MKRAIEALHKAYVTPRTEEEARAKRLEAHDAPSLRALAKRFGVAFAEANRAATDEHWELERRAKAALAWKRRSHPDAPEDEAGFTRHVADRMFGHLPEPYAEAVARSIWWRALSCLAQWRAVCAEDAERAAHAAAPTWRRELSDRRSRLEEHVYAAGNGALASIEALEALLRRRVAASDLVPVADAVLSAVGGLRGAACRISRERA